MQPEGRRLRYKLVVSDFHLGKGRYLRDGTQNILEDFIYDREFAEFLSFHRTGEFQNAEVELILNGDILNLLQMDTYGIHTHMFTERSVVRAVEKIVSGHPEFFQALRRFAATPGHSIAYVIGNHDAGMLFQGAKKVFSAACGAEVSFYDVSYIFDGIHVEHGQQFEDFAKIDMKRPFISKGLPEPVLNLPWGSLYVACVMPGLKQERPHLDKVRPMSAFLKWVIFQDPLWGLQTLYKTVRFIVDTLLLKRRYQILQGVRGTLRLLKDMSMYPSFDHFAEKILEQNDSVHTVIFGHTHILKYRQYREGKQYFNEGSWNQCTNLELGDYGQKVRLTYAMIEYPAAEATSENLRPWVRLKQWNGHWRPDMEIIV